MSFFDTLFGSACAPAPEASPLVSVSAPEPGVIASLVDFPGLSAALGAAAPHADQSVWVPALNAAFARFDFSTARRVSGAIGQFVAEAGDGFSEIVENLNYTHASRICQVFPDEFPTLDSAQTAVGNPEVLANICYAHKLGNGDAASGDGWKYRGRSLIQLTGRDEYTAFATAVGMSPEDASAYAATPEGAAVAGCWYLSSRGCLPLLDSWSLAAVTITVNGRAMEGYSTRVAAANSALRALGGQ